MTEMQKLKEMLTDSNIPFQIIRENVLEDLLSNQMVEVDHIYYPNKEKFSEQFEKTLGEYEYSKIDSSCSVICHWGTCGYESGLLEILGLYDDDENCYDPIGWLTAENVFNRINKNWKKELAEQ